MRAGRPSWAGRGRYVAARPVSAARPGLWPQVLSALRPAALETARNGGESICVSHDLRHDLAALADAPFPVEGASSDAMAQAFRLQARALLDVVLPGRRAAIAAGVLGSIEALEGLIADQGAQLTEVWRKRMGAGD